VPIVTSCLVMSGTSPIGARSGTFYSSPLSALCGFGNVADFQVGHRQWVDAALRMCALARDDRWSKSVAVGSDFHAEPRIHVTGSSGLRPLLPAGDAERYVSFAQHRLLWQN